MKPCRRGLKTRVSKFLSLAVLAALAVSAAASAATPALPSIPRPALTSTKPLKAEGFDPADVALRDSPFRKAMQKDIDYLWSLNPDRFLSKFRSNAGLIPKAPPFRGWGSMGVAGQTMGHYLSACARVYRDTGDTRFRDRVNYIVDELADCQARDPKGLVAALPDRDEAFYKLKDRGGRMIGWVPWYTMHKLFAGLRDAYELTGSQKAKTVMVKLADWADATVAPLTDSEMETMLQQEQGGMAETLADVYAITGNQKYLALARRFCNKAVMDPLSRGEDKLTGLHANTQIPKIIGASRMYELTGEPYFKTVADTFWESVAEHRSYVIGGNSDGEHFFDVAQFARHLSPETCETCNTYNMLKLTEREFGYAPSARFMDFYERGLYNHILASQDPDTGMFTYFVPLQPGRFKIYSDPTDAMWCCVGTGMENHTRYNEAIYMHSAPGTNGDPALYINLFIPSTLQWREQSVRIEQETRFPEAPSTRLTIQAKKPTRFTLRIRRPEWLAGPMTVRVNGKAEAASVGTDDYAALNRTWKTGDKVEVALPMALHAESLPGAAQWQAMMYGPIVLSAELGKVGLIGEKWLRTNQLAANNVPVPPTPVVIGTPATLVKDLAPVPGKPLTFRAAGKAFLLSDGKPEGDLTFIPFYEIHRERYAVYLPLYSQADWDAHQAEIRAEAARLAALEARTVDQVDPGAQQSDVDHTLRSERSRSGAGSGGGRWRDAESGGWFEYTVKTLPDTPLTLLCTYWGDDGAGRTFDILVDGQVIGTTALKADHPGKYFDIAYPIPETLTNGKTSVVVRFQGKPGQITGGVFGIRVMKPE